MTSSRSVTLAALVSRGAVLLAGLLAVVALGYPGGRPPVRDFDGELLNLQSRFDARWYVQIATTGYAFDPALPADVQQNIVFFPAYPMAVRAVGRLLGGRLAAFFIAGTFLSIAAFIGALCYVHAFARDMQLEGADTAVWLLTFYPFAVFFGALYTESFFLLSAAGAMYHYRRAQFTASAAWGLAAGLCRPNGFLVAVPLAWQAGAHVFEKRRLDTRLLAAFAPIAGVALFSWFVWWKTGDPLAWERGHVAWGRTYQGFIALVADRYHIIADNGVSGYLTTLPHDALNALGALFTLATAWPVARALGPEYALWMLLTILPPIAAGGFISTGRFSSVLFPSFVWLASAIPARHRAGWFVGFAVLQLVCAAMFYTWRPLY